MGRTWPLLGLRPARAEGEALMPKPLPQPQEIILGHGSVFITPMARGSLTGFLFQPAQPDEADRDPTQYREGDVAVLVDTDAEGAVSILAKFFSLADAWRRQAQER